VNIAVYVRTGQYLEPAGKEGVAALTGWLLAHGGAGTNTAEQMEERLAFLAADLGADVSDTQGSVSLNLLSKDVEEGFGILRDALFAPHFQADKITLRKQQLLQEMKQRNDDSAAIGKRYRRQDEIGTPWAVTVDHQTLEDETVTIRDRDSLDQQRVSISQLGDELESRLRQPWTTPKLSE